VGMPDSGVFLFSTLRVRQSVVPWYCNYQSANQMYHAQTTDSKHAELVEGQTTEKDKVPGQ
jgi:hypothetical protein